MTRELKSPPPKIADPFKGQYHYVVPERTTVVPPYDAFLDQFQQLNENIAKLTKAMEKLANLKT